MILIFFFSHLSFNLNDVCFQIFTIWLIAVINFDSNLQTFFLNFLNLVIFYLIPNEGFHCYFIDQFESITLLYLWLIWLINLFMLVQLTYDYLLNSSLISAFNLRRRIIVSSFVNLEPLTKDLPSIYDGHLFYYSNLTCL